MKHGETTSPGDVAGRAVAGSVSGEPRWPAVLSVLATVGLWVALPRTISPASPWILAVWITPCLVAAIVTHRLHKPRENAVAGIALTAGQTLYLLVALAQLVLSLPKHVETPKHLLFSAVALWVSNVLVFALWYWRIDAGGPSTRDLRRKKRERHESAAFLFPQMTINDSHWHPQFVDYLFLAFNTSTALSPTDTAVLDRRAKLLTMLQASISLVTVAIVAARAINIL